MTKVENLNGARGVVISQRDNHSIEVLTRREGFQWVNMPMDRELLDMLEEAIKEFKETYK
jgi:hypothetical protein